MDNCSNEKRKRKDDNYSAENNIPKRLYKYNVHKCVTFQNSVDIFSVTDAWKLQKDQTHLKNDEEQANRRLQNRNY